MPSPFPGMNPYLEQASVWTDFHARFISASSEAIGSQIAPAYYVRIEEQLYVHEFAHPFARADFALAKSPNQAPTESSGIATAIAPMQLTDPSAPRVDHERIPFLEVFTRDGRRIVTIIELLSPTNKYSGPDRQAFLRKRDALLQRGVNYVEFDLLRGGPRMPIDDLPRCDYYAYVNRFNTRPIVDFWPITLRDRLPKIPIPVLPQDRDAIIELQEIVNTVYERARYELTIYAGQPEPALSREDAAWAQQFIPPQA